MNSGKLDVSVGVFFPRQVAVGSHVVQTYATLADDLPAVVLVHGIGASSDYF